MELKNNLRRLRFNANEMTQQELADKLQVSRQTIYAIEKGKFNPSVRLAIHMAELFDVAVEDIFYLNREG
ncbi:MAG: helix-turn-helix transcriptional regulator [candidate division Zixibacteria bacterium]|nr:helix-turn-helix transcriptional regulator [candidate division Zixibacteria bacterium]